MIATRLAEAMGRRPDEVRTVHQFALLRFLGCTSDASETAAMFGGDDLAINAAMAPVVMGSGREMMGQFVRSVAPGQPWTRRVRLVARGLADPKGTERSLSTHCEVGAMLAERVGLGQSVVDALADAYERWDGKGFPARLAGDALPLAVRIVVVAREGDLATALGADPRKWMSKRRGRAYDPSVVDAFEQVGADVLSDLERQDEWEAAPVVMYDHHRLFSKGFRDSMTEEERNNILDAIAERRYAEFEGNAPVLAPRGAPNGLDENTDPIGREFGEFYSMPRGYHLNSITQFTMTSGMSFMNFPLLANIEWISPRSILFVTGEHAHSRYFSEDAYELAAEPKKLYFVPNADHVDLYDRTNLIPFDKLEAFFIETLLHVAGVGEELAASVA